MAPPDARFLTAVILAFTLEFKVTLTVMAETQYDVSNSKHRSEETFIIPMKDRERIKYVAAIIDSLEKLGVLDPSKQLCYTLDKIVKTKVVDNEGNPWKIGISLHVNEVGGKRLKSHDGTVTSLPGSDAAMTPSGTNSDVVSQNAADSREACILGSKKLSGIVDKPNVEKNIITDNASELNGNDVKTSNGSGNVSSVAMVADSTGKQTENKQGSSFDTETNDTDESAGGTRLSKTQVMVISTCSTVVGVFFIVAVILRVNNYIKRIREEQAAARRPSYRSTSIGLRSNSQSEQNNQNNAKDGRLEAALNKDSDTAAMDPSRKDEDDDGDITPKLSNQETRPLLIVTAASAPSSPCLQRTRADYQYSNKDDDETMTADEKHGQKTSNKQAGKNKDISNRRRPKQRRNNNGYTRVDGPASDTSLREEDEEEDQDSDDENSCPNSPDTNSNPITENGTSKKMTNRVPNGVPLTGPVPKDKPGGVNSGVDKPEIGLRDWSEKDQPHLVEHHQGHAPDVESEDPEELEEVVTHGLETYLSSIPEQSDLDGIGFTQSDSSLSSSSNNPSYRYGNQVEYTGVQQYPNIEYCPEYTTETYEPPQETRVEPEPRRQIKRMGDLPKVPFKTFESFDQCPASVERQVSVDSLTYNESPPMKRQLSSSFQGRSFDEQPEKEKQEFWLEEEAGGDTASPSADSTRFAFPNERFSFRDDRLPNIQEDDSCEQRSLQKRGSRERKFRNSGKTGVLTRQKNTIQEDAETSLTGEQGDNESQRQSKGRHFLANGEVENESSDSDSSEVASSTLLPSTQSRTRKKRHRKSNQNTGWSILEDPDFEGMEPTYV